MSTSILVTYASRYGSTKEVAEVVAATLREQGLTVELLPMRQVTALADYAAVVLGAPLYIGHWHKDAQKFLAKHRETLTQRPVALFTLGPLGKDEKEWEGVRTQLEQQMAQVAWLKPVAQTLFGGRYDPARLRFPDNLLTWFPATPLHQLPAGDVRDWAAIRAWAGGLAAQLQPAPAR
ncbi:MAG: flavodoxin domain-containing protein [Caldilineaceae bacterium]|nr:flavodoxin domain-containing protein [Caldilineaceae bacterium]